MLPCFTCNYRNHIISGNKCRCDADRNKIDLVDMSIDEDCPINRNNVNPVWGRKRK